jgi:hypothetical protein
MGRKTVSEISLLVQQAKEHGATFIVEKDSIRVRAPEPIPDDLLDLLRKNKIEILRYLQQLETKLWPGDHLLEEWRRISIPDWREKLKVAIENRNIKGEEYARWMLKEILEDPDYKEDK